MGRKQCSSRDGPEEERERELEVKYNLESHAPVLSQPEAKHSMHELVGDAVVKPYVRLDHLSSVHVRASLREDCWADRRSQLESRAGTQSLHPSSSSFVVFLGSVFLLQGPRSSRLFLVWRPEMTMKGCGQQVCEHFA